MSLNFEGFSPVPEKQWIKIHRRIIKVGKGIAYSLKASGDIKALGERFESDLGMDNVGMIDQLVQTNFNFDEWRQQPVRSGLLVGLMVRNRLISSWSRQRRWQVEPFVPNLLAIYNAYTGPRQDNAYSLDEILQRSRHGWAAQQLWADLDSDLREPFTNIGEASSQAVNALYAGALCLLATDGVTALYQQAMQQDQSRVEKGLLTAEWQNYMRQVVTTEQVSGLNQQPPETLPPTN